MNSKLSGDFMSNDPIFKEKIEKSSKTRVPPPENGQIQNGRLSCWGKNWVFDILSNFGLYFLAESVLLDDFHAKEFIF